MPIQTYLQNLFCHTRELLFGSHLSRRMAINHFFFWSLSRENLCPPRPEHPGTTHNPGISVEFNHNNGNYTTNNVASLCTARKPEVPCRYCAPYRIDRRRGSPLLLQLPHLLRCAVTNEYPLLHVSVHFLPRYPQLWSQLNVHTMHIQIYYLAYNVGLVLRYPQAQEKE